MSITGWPWDLDDLTSRGTAHHEQEVAVHGHDSQHSPEQIAPAFMTGSQIGLSHIGLGGLLAHPAHSKRAQHGGIRLRSTLNGNGNWLCPLSDMRSLALFCRTKKGHAGSTVSVVRMAH